MFNHDNISLLIQRISLGKLFFIFNNCRYYVDSASLVIKYEAELLYEQFIEENLFEPFIRKDNLNIILQKLNLWDSEDDNLLSETEKKLENTKLNLYKHRLNKQKKESYKDNIKEIKESINKLLLRKHSLDYITLEDAASTKKSDFIFINTIKYYDSNQLVFENDVNSIDSTFYSSIINEISNYSITMEQYKKIARHESWRTIWNSNKNNIFNKPSVELTDEQKSLLNISSMYDRVYEHHEAPDETVINDDDMLEGWMIYQKRKSEAASKENKANDILSKHGDAKEIFIVGEKEDVEDIYSLNSYESNRIVKQRQSVIKQTQEIDEINLPDVRSELLQRANSRR
jgi:hypothetical protein